MREKLAFCWRARRGAESREWGELGEIQGDPAGEPEGEGIKRKASPEKRAEKICKRRETVWAAAARGGTSVCGPAARAVSAWRVRVVSLGLAAIRRGEKRRVVAGRSSSRRRAGSSTRRMGWFSQPAGLSQRERMSWRELIFPRAGTVTEVRPVKEVVIS